MSDAEVRITLHGAYNGANFGDFLLSQLFLGWLAEAGVRNVWVSRASPKFDAYVDVPEGLVVNRGITEHIVFGGGGYMGAPASQSVKWKLGWSIQHTRCFFKAAFFARSVAAFGVGVGPFIGWPQTTIVKRAISRCKAFYPRDKESVGYGEQINPRAQEAVDAAFILASGVSSRSVEGRRKPLVGLHLSSGDRNSEELIPVFEGLVRLRESVGDFDVVGLVDQDNTNGARHQEDTARHVSSLFGSISQTNLSVFNNVNEFVEEIKKCDLVVTTKLHVGIVARCFGIPVASFPTHIKTERLYRQLGESHCCRNLSSCSAEDAYGVLLGAYGRIGYEPIDRAIVGRAEALKGDFIQYVRDLGGSRYA